MTSIVVSAGSLTLREKLLDKLGRCQAYLKKTYFWQELLSYHL